MNEDSVNTDSAAIYKQDSGLWQSFVGLTTVVRERFDGLIRLAVLESRLAGLSLVYMVLLALLGGAFIISGWLLLNVAAAFWIVQNGWMTVAWIALLLAVINLVAAAIAIVTLKKLSKNLLFTGSRTQLFESPAEEVADAEI